MSQWAEIRHKHLVDEVPIDLLRCADCGARRRFIALITEAEPIQRILTHLGLAPHPPPIAPARRLAELDVPF